MCPNLERLKPWVEENEPYIEALNMSAFSSMSVNVLYFFRWADALFEDFYAFSKFLTVYIGKLGFPLELSADNMFPDEKFMTGLRTGKDTDIFGTPWIQNNISGEPGGDVYSPNAIPVTLGFEDDGTPIIQPANFGGPEDPRPDGKVDGWNWLQSANSLVTTVALVLVLKFAGKDLLRFFSGSGGWVEAATRQFNPKLRYYRASASFDDVDINTSDESPNDDLSAFLDGHDLDPANYGPAIIQAIDKLATAMDTNRTNDYLTLKDFIASIDNPERVEI
jgi:hypothetical protein